MTGQQEAQVAKLVSLIVKIGALGFIVFLPQTYAIQLQLLGGVWIIQTLPAVLIGAYTRWFDDWALFVGWVVGIAVGTWMAAMTGFTSSTFQLDLFGFVIPGYAALYAVVLNLVVAAVLTPVFRAIRSGERPIDETAAADYAG